MAGLVALERCRGDRALDARVEIVEAAPRDRADRTSACDFIQSYDLLFRQVLRLLHRPRLLKA